MNFKKRFAISRAIQSKNQVTILWHPASRIPSFLLKNHINLKVAKYKKDHGTIVKGVK